MKISDILIFTDNKTWRFIQIDSFGDNMKDRGGIVKEEYLVIILGFFSYFFIKHVVGTH